VRPYEIPTDGDEPVSRRDQLLAASARLFAERGYRGVAIDDIGAAVGISGPAIYRHVNGKQEILAALLVGISQYLLDEGSALADGCRGRDLLERLVAFHLDFSLGSPDLIVIQDRDLDSLADDARRQVRRLQRAYLDVWVVALRDACTGLGEEDARVRAHACFGLLNATPHLEPAIRDDARDTLARMALAALLS
jgi:AcrR family transcriptional regulator